MSLIAAIGGRLIGIPSSPSCFAKSKFPIRQLRHPQRPMKKRVRSFAKRNPHCCPSQQPDTPSHARAPVRVPGPPVAAQSEANLGTDIRRNTPHRSAASGTSMSGGKYAGRSRVIPLRLRRARPISTTRSYLHKPSLRLRISISAPRTPCAIFSCARSRWTKKRSASCRTSSTPAIRLPRRRRNRAGAARQRSGATHRHRRSARTIRACNRGADRPASGRTEHRPTATG